MKRIQKLALVTIAAVLVLTVIGYFNIWRSPAFYTEGDEIALAVLLMSADDYGKISGTHPQPYIVELETKKGALILYGSIHTQDVNDPQIAEIRQKWDMFRPTVALVEGRLGFLFRALQNPIIEYGEMGEVMDLARTTGIPVYTWEPGREQEIAFVQQEFSKEQTVLFFILRPYFSTYRFGRPDDPDQVAEALIRERGNSPGMEGTIQTVQDIDAIWARDFSGFPDWRDTSDEHGLPGYLADISARANEARDEHFVRVILDLLERGERVFAIAGSSHAVRLEPALSGELEVHP